MFNLQNYRLQGMKQSYIRSMTTECNKVKGINLGQGLCKLPTPDFIKEAAIEAINTGVNFYSSAEGIIELREAISKKLERDNNIVANPNNIIITNGSTGAFTSTINSLLRPKDGILLFEPFYGYHRNISILAGLEPQYLELKFPEFTIDEKMLVDSIRPNTKAIVLCTPANPSGKMWSKKEIDIIASVSEHYNLLVITDEIYEYITYDGRKHYSPASNEKLNQRTVTIMGFSKTFSVTGWRLGYAVASKKLANEIKLANDLYYVCSPTPFQKGIIAGLQAPISYYENMRTSFEIKRNKLYNALKNIGFNPILPQGAYYMMADISKLKCKNSLEAAMTFLQKTQVAAVPGSAFYEHKSGEKFLRFCFAVESEILDKACCQILSF